MCLFNHVQIHLDESDIENNKVLQARPIYLKDYERNQLLEKGR